MQTVKRFFYFLKYKLRDNLPKKIVNLYSKRFTKTDPQYFSEEKRSFGKLNEDKVFYVIRRRPPGWGFFSNVFYVLQGLHYASSKGYIPIVDMENYWVGELSSLQKINGTKNAWCYFFNQVSQYSLDEVYKSKNVVLSNGYSILGKDNWLSNRTASLVTNYNLLKKANNIIESHIKLNNETLKFIESIKLKLQWDREKTLGIFIRGTPYFEKIHFPSDTVPSLKEFVSQVKNIANKHSLNRLYISTEDYRVYSYLCAELEEFEIVKSIRYDSEEKIRDWGRSQKMTHVDGLVNMGFDKTLVYLAEMFLLIDSTIFLASFSNASAFVLASRDLNDGGNYLVLKNETINIIP